MSTTNNAYVASDLPLIYLVKRQEFVVLIVKPLKWLMFGTKHVFVDQIFAPYSTFLVQQNQSSAQNASINQWSILYLDFANVVLANYRPIMKLDKKSVFFVETAKLQQ
jgi:hypothetical protein